MWLSKRLRLARARQHVYGGKSCFILALSFQKLVQIHMDVFIQKHTKKLSRDNAFHNSSFSIEKNITETFGSWIDYRTKML